MCVCLFVLDFLVGKQYLLRKLHHSTHENLLLITFSFLCQDSFLLCSLSSEKLIKQPRTHAIPPASVNEVLELQTTIAGFHSHIQ